jgi:pimeloyl-ACP methyl ester carboxylesterase
MSTNEKSRTYQSHDGLELFYRDYNGEMPGTPVICLPGLTRNSRDFIHVAEHIGERRRVIAPDFRGRGFSAHDANWKNYHPGTYVTDTWTLLDELGIETVIIIGTSLGGLCAMAMSAMNAERLAAVIMNDVGPEINPAGLARIQSYVGKQTPPKSWDEAADQAFEAYSDTMPGLPRTYWERMAWRAYREGPDGVPVLDYDQNIGRAVREVGAQVADPWVFFEALKPVPTTLLWGEGSDILTRDIVDKMLARHEEMRLVPVANRGHAPQLDEPECLAAIDDVLEATP